MTHDIPHAAWPNFASSGVSRFQSGLASKVSEGSWTAGAPKGSVRSHRPFVVFLRVNFCWWPENHCEAVRVLIQSSSSTPPIFLLSCHDLRHLRWWRQGWRKQPFHSACSSKTFNGCRLCWLKHVGNSVDTTTKLTGEVEMFGICDCEAPGFFGWQFRKFMKSMSPGAWLTTANLADLKPTSTFLNFPRARPVLLLTGLECGRTEKTPDMGKKLNNIVFLREQFQSLEKVFAVRSSTSWSDEWIITSWFLLKYAVVHCDSKPSQSALLNFVYE